MKPPAEPLLFRLVATAPDGLVVTIGKYRSKAEAEEDHARHAASGYYRKLAIQNVPAPRPAEPTAGR